MGCKVKCKACGKTVRGKGTRLQTIRRHYSERHPRIWRESVRCGAEKRASQR